MKESDPETAALAAELGEPYWARAGDFLKVVGTKEVRVAAEPNAEKRGALLREIASIYEERLNQPELAFLALARAYRPGDEVEMSLDAWDTASLPADIWRAIRNDGDVDAEIVVITAGEGRKTPEWAPETLERVSEAGRGVDKSGLLAPAHLMPVYALGKS